MSMAVRRVCRRDGTKTSAGLVGECFMMEWYTGLAMDSRRVWVWLTLKPYQEEEDVQKNIHNMFSTVGFGLVFRLVFRGSLATPAYVCTTSSLRCIRGFSPAKFCCSNQRTEGVAENNDVEVVR